MTTTFETASIGDEVWCVSLGWGAITDIIQTDDYPIVVRFDTRKLDTFTMEGRLYKDDLNPTLFWSEVRIVVPTKPRPKLNKDDCVEVWNTLTIDPTITYKRHFSHFENGQIFCFDNGGTSWTSNQTVSWDRWRKPE